MNYFHLMSLEERYDICKDSLETNYIALQKQHHPDNNLNQFNGLEIMNQAIEINKAYETLGDNLDRAIYMLKLYNISLDSAEKIDTNMLLDILDRREYIESLNDNTKLQESLDTVQNDIDDLYAILVELFNKKNYQAALDITIQLKYLVNIEKLIKKYLSQWNY